MPRKRKVSKKKVSVAEPIHLKLDKPVTLRKHVLGATIDVARMLKSYEELKRVRETKNNIYDSLHKLCDRMAKFEKDIDDTGIVGLAEDEKPSTKKEDILDSKPREEDFIELEKKIPKVKKSRPIPKKKTVVHSEIDDLKSELANIEKELKGL